MIDTVWVVIVVQLLVSLYLAWKVGKLSHELEMMKFIVGGILMDLNEEEEDQ